jgi:hypothetical protein
MTLSNGQALVGPARHIRQALKPDGTWLVVEPYASDEAAIRRLVTLAGFTRFRHAAETPFPPRARVHDV